jgi:hypothetical protein
VVDEEQDAAHRLVCSWFLYVSLKIIWTDLISEKRKSSFVSENRF